MSKKNILPPGKEFNSTLEPDVRSLCKDLDEECLQKRLVGTLEELLLYAHFNPVFADELCEQVSKFARGDHHKVSIIKQYAVAGSGRFQPNSHMHDFLLLSIYLSKMIDTEHVVYTTRKKEAMELLIQRHKQITGVTVSKATMANRISAAIKIWGDDKRLSWGKSVIEERKARGKNFNH